jgi:hypothetical protein
MEKRIARQLQSFTRRRAALLKLIEALEAYRSLAGRPAREAWRHPACRARTAARRA